MKGYRVCFQRIIKIGIWCIVFILLFNEVSKILLPKYYFNTSVASPETELWNSFYQEEQESIDIIFLGSSHIYNGINPIIVYDITHMTGFDLSSSGQDIPTSYFYLKESLQYQHPSYVVLDTYGIFLVLLQMHPSIKDLWII